MKERYLTEEERKRPQKVLWAVDYAILHFGYAVLDCGHESDGAILNLVKDEDTGGYMVLCENCFERYGKFNEVNHEIVNIDVDYRKIEVGEGGLKVFTTEISKFRRRENDKR